MSLSLEGAQGLNLVIATATAGANLTGVTGAATTYTTSAFGYLINGVPFAKAAVAGGASPTTDGNTGTAFPALAPSKAAAFVWGVDSGGTVKVYKGPTIDWNGTDVLALPFPSVPATIAVFAVQSVKAGSTASAWTFGASNWNATGITSAATQAGGVMPATPLTT